MRDWALPLTGVQTAPSNSTVVAFCGDAFSMTFVLLEEERGTERAGQLGPTIDGRTGRFERV
jgi:hypothetical protein